MDMPPPRISVGSVDLSTTAGLDSIRPTCCHIITACQTSSARTPQQQTNAPATRIVPDVHEGLCVCKQSN